VGVNEPIGRPVGITGPVGVAMVATMVGSPPQRTALGGRRAEQSEHELHGPRRPERPVREVAMVEGSDGEHAQQIRGRADRQGNRADADPDHPHTGDVKKQERGEPPPVEGRRRAAGGVNLRF